MWTKESLSVGGTSRQLPKLMPEPQSTISCPSVALQVVGKVPKFSTFSGDSTQKREVSFEQWVFEVKRVMQNHGDNIEGGNSTIFTWSCS